MESNRKKRDWAIILIITVGALLRLALGFYNPPNNGFDNYLEPIAYYVNMDNRPSPGACWECYQPPLFFYIAEGIFKTTFLFTDSYFYSWKAIQLLNFLFSLGTLLIIYKMLLKVFPNDRSILMVVLAILSIYPRDIYTSAMISNDTMLVFLVTLSSYLFLKYWTNKNNLLLIYLCLAVISASLTKQHGLITLLFLGSISIKYLLSSKGKIYHLLIKPPIFLPLSTFILCLGDELWKYNITHQLLVSNQHFFNYTSTQLPGSLERIEFFSFHLLALFNNPFLSQSTLYSYWTALFASSWFDYEWRFTTPTLPAVNYLAIILYVFGMLLYLLWIAGITKELYNMKKAKFSIVILLLVGGCFLLVPLMQTLRFPYYSSMKSLFFLPALGSMALALAYGLRHFNWLKKPRVAYTFVGFTLVIGILHVCFVINYLSISLLKLSGPMWPFPNILLQ